MNQGAVPKYCRQTTKEGLNESYDSLTSLVTQMRKLLTGQVRSVGGFFCVPVLESVTDSSLPEMFSL